MHCCEFCRTEFLARPQVKKPRACNNCQGDRQRANERAWHRRHAHFDDRYHSVRREQRLRKIKELADALVECLRVGQSLLGFSIKLAPFAEKLGEFLAELGVRRINKFCDL